MDFRKEKRVQLQILDNLVRMDRGSDSCFFFFSDSFFLSSVFCLFYSFYVLCLFFFFSWIDLLFNPYYIFIYFIYREPSLFDHIYYCWNQNKTPTFSIFSSKKWLISVVLSGNLWKRKNSLAFCFNFNNIVLFIAE